MLNKNSSIISCEYNDYISSVVVHVVRSPKQVTCCGCNVKKVSTFFETELSTTN